jgi:hypothetical protein
MLSPDLAELYRVETRALVQAVRRNLDRFPADFMFQLSREEYANTTPYAFTEQGVAMLSAVLRSDRAIQMSILLTSHRRSRRSNAPSKIRGLTRPSQGAAFAPRGRVPSVPEILRTSVARST